MALGPPFLVRIEKKSIGVVTNQVRSGLDHRKIEPISFKATEDGLWFEISFHQEDEAYLFEREFQAISSVAV